MQSLDDTIGYIRISKEDQGVDWKTSLRHQTTEITSRATALGRVLQSHLIFEDRFSGEEALNRGGFMSVVEYCRAHPRPRSHPGYAIFLNDSRFGRFEDPDEAAYWRFEISKTGWIVRFVENDDTESRSTRHLLRAMGGAQASEYLANIKYNARKGARGAAELGLWQNEAPFGYRRMAIAADPTRPREPVILDVGQRKADDQVVLLTPGPEDEQRTLLWIFETYDAGTDSLASIARRLLRRWPDRKWSKQQVRRMLSNEVYLGTVIWCRRPHDKKERRDTPIRPPSEWVVTRDAHPALISPDLFDRVQTRLAKNQKELRRTDGGYALSGLIRCAHCGKPYIGGGGKHGPVDDPDRYRFYCCSGGKGENPVCEGYLGTLQKRSIEPLVINEVARVVSDPVVQALVEGEIDRYLQQLYGGSDLELARLQKDERRVKQERGNLVNAIASGLIEETEAQTAMQRIRTELKRVEQDIAQQRRLQGTREEVESEKERLIALARNFPLAAQSVSGSALRELLRPWIEDAEMDKFERTLTLTIRRVPASAEVILSSRPPGPGSR